VEGVGVLADADDQGVAIGPRAGGDQKQQGGDGDRGQSPAAG